MSMAAATAARSAPTRTSVVDLVALRAFPLDGLGVL
jgi:hypothetical protein